ncbi:hypothetical protein RFI_27498, partial [Reticulomyxa filosa]
TNDLFYVLTSQKKKYVSITKIFVLLHMRTKVAVEYSLEVPIQAADDAQLLSSAERVVSGDEILSKVSIPKLVHGPTAKENPVRNVSFFFFELICWIYLKNIEKTIKCWVVQSQPSDHLVKKMSLQKKKMSHIINPTATEVPTHVKAMMHANEKYPLTDNTEVEFELEKKKDEEGVAQSEEEYIGIEQEEYGQSNRLINHNNNDKIIIIIMAIMITTIIIIKTRTIFTRVI